MYQLRSKNNFVYHQLPTIDKKYWVSVYDLIHIYNDDGYSIVLEEFYKNNQMIQKKKWNQIMEWSKNKQEKLSIIFQEMRNKYHNYQYYLNLEFPNNQFILSKHYIQKIKCLHHQFKIEIAIDALIHGSLINKDSKYYIIAFQTGKEWSELNNIKTQFLLKFSKLFNNIWDDSGYFIYHYQTKDLIWKNRDNNIITLCDNYIKKIRLYKKYAHFYYHNELPTFLYPNMKIDRDVWFEFKKEKAIQYNEISLLWNIGKKTRKLIRNDYIYDWNNNQFNIWMKNFNIEKFDIIKRIISINQQDTFFLGKTRDWIQQYQYDSFENSIHYFLDFEYDEKKNIYMIGYYYSNQYHVLWNLSDSDKNVIIDFLNQISFHKNKKVYIWYWHIEYSILEKKCKQYNIDFFNHNVEWLDLCKIIRNGIVFKNAYDFSLKSIVSSLSKLGYLNSYKNLDIQSGESSLIYIDKFRKTGDLSLKKQLENYNELDCYAMYIIYQLIFYHPHYLLV